MNALPLLLPCREDGARDLISLLGECCSAKEVVIAVQEALERLEISFEAEENSEEDDPDYRSLNEQLLQLIRLYESGKLFYIATMWSCYIFTAVPRLKLRKKTASETIKPLFSHMQSVLELSRANATRDEGREIIVAVSNLCHKIALWAQLQPETQGDESSVHNVGKLLRGLFRYSVFFRAFSRMRYARQLLCILTVFRLPWPRECFENVFPE